MANPHNYINQGDDNPWKGLNFYVEGEALYGRDSEIQRFTQFIVNNSQTVLYGKSGIGKSSVINAGIFPIARQQGLFPVPLRLGHSQQSNASYLEQIKGAFKESCIGINPLCDAIDEESESLWEFFHRHTFFQPETGNTVRPLVVFDQFEEIFTLQHNEAAKKEFFSQLADLINEVKPRYIFDVQYSSDNRSNGSHEATSLQDLKDFVRNISNESQQSNYVEESLFNLIFVIREDYLSYFERYTAYIPALKANRFPLLPLNEEQAAEIIMKPREGLVSKEVAELIIQKVTGSTEFTLDGIPEIEVNATMLSLYLSRLYLKKGNKETITAEMVNQFGDYIIKDFYEESVADLPQDEIEKLEDALITYDGRRDNDSLINLKHKDEKGRVISDETIKKLVEERRLLRLFSYQGDQRLEFMHDTLCDTINKRIERRQQEAKNKRIKEEEQRHHEHETLLLKKRNRRRAKWLIFAASFLTFLVGYFIKLQLYDAEYSCIYANFTTVDGWPVGIEEIDPNDKSVTDSLVVYYRLTRNGRLNQGDNPFYKVEVISAYDHKPSTNRFIESPAVGLWYSEFLDDTKGTLFAQMQKQTAYWTYSANEHDSQTAGKCTAFDRNHHVLYSIQFNKDNTTTSADEKKYVQWAVYYDASGKQMMINDKGIDRMRQTVNNGIVTSCVFFSMLGIPQKNERGAYGYEYEINDTTHLMQKQYRVDQFGERTDETPIVFLDYQHGRVKETSLYKVHYPQPGMIVKQFQNYNDTLSFHLGNDNMPKFGSLHPYFTKADSVISFSYNENGLPLIRQIRSIGKVLYSEAYTYFDGTDKYKEIRRTTESNGNYTERYAYPNDSTDVVSLWKDGKKATLSLLNEKGDELCYHSCTTTKRIDSKYAIETKVYRDSVGSLIKPDPSGEEEYVNQYCKFEIYRDKQSNNILYEYYRDYNDRIQKSELFEYDDYGNLIAIAVAGVDLTPVRCIEWSWYGMCCYKMSVLFSFYAKEQNTSVFGNKIFASMHGINEFDENSLIMGPNYLNLSIDESPMGFFTRPSGDKIQTGFIISETKRSQSDMSCSAYFIHILSKNGVCYSAGLLDGDIIVSIDGKKANDINTKQLENHGNCHLVIARPNIDKNSYDHMEFSIPAGKPLIHVHQMQLTDVEFNRLNQSIR